MNLAELHKKLIEAARGTPPSEHVPYAFEKRIMARISAHPVLDAGALWAQALWRATAPCFAIMMLLAAWSFFGTPGTSNAEDLSQAFENTVFAAGDPEPPADAAW